MPRSRSTTLLAFMVLAVGASAQAEDQVKLAVGARGNWETAASELGQKAGFFKKRGLVLEILYTQGSGETQLATISGSVDIGIGLGTTSVMNAFAKGAPLRVIGNASTGSSEYWFVPATSPVQSIKDAAGKTIAYSSAGASSHLEVLGFLKFYGIEAKPVATGGTASTMTQVMSGQVDVGWSSPPFGLDAAQAGKIRIVGRGSDLPYFRDQTIRLIVANANYLEKNKDVVARFVQAYRDTLDWMYTDPAGLKAYAEMASVPEETAKQVRDVFYPRENMKVDHVSGLDSVMADGVAFKYQAAPLSKEQIAELFQIPPAIK
ncbi:MAG: NitT/TauT family transport system substrate-binding protein [Alphaproteobacteria bacterium]|nr:NitT/TauT family transport system substrate-binding protein [Alphaproteobacteria bacterium]